MTKRLRGLVSFLLVLVLCFGMIPNVSAAEIGATESTLETEATEATTAETTTPPDETSPTETSGETNPPTEESTTPTTEATVPQTEPDDVFSDIVISSGVAAASTDDYGIMTAASTQSGILLFDFSDNGDYTSRLNSQLTVKYKPNGTGTTRTAYIKNLGWHFARYNNTPYADDPLYCIEPWRDYAASTSGNSVDRDITLDGSSSTTGGSVWYAMPAARREAIGLILLYSDQMWDDSISVFNVKRDSNPNVPLRVATQFLIYEIVCGLRDAETFTLNSTNESGTAGDIFYNAGAAAISNFAPNYNTLVSYVQSAMEIPSFTSSSSSTAPTITLTGDETSVYDSNGVLSNFTFTDGNGAEFYKSGNTLYIYQTGTISSSTVFKATRYIPSASNSTYNLWYMSGSSYQTTISLASASSGNLNAYFKLKAPSAATLGIQKTTEDGNNLSGWQFGIYSNSACTSLVSGPHTTNSSGAITVSNLAAGTVYVKELGHSDSTIDAMYSCTSTNPQKVTLTAGQTSSVSFYNELDPSGLELTKTTEDGKNLAGWQFGIYSNSACTTMISGPHTTDTNGKISVSDLSAGTVYVKELGHTDSAIDAMYSCSSTNPQKVTLTAGQTSTVSFYNELDPSGLELTKTTENGLNLSGWQFSIYSDAACTDLISGPHTTDANGKISVADLSAGTVYVKELGHTDSSVNALYTCSSENPQKVTLTAGQTATVSFHNVLNTGGVKLVKETNTGENLAGWQIGLYYDADCTQPIDGSPFLTGADGTITVTDLDPGTLYAKEIPTDDPYWEFDTEVKKVTIAVNQTATVTFTNTHYGRIEFRKTTNTGNHLDGWTFRVHDSNYDVVGEYTTDENGYACTENLPLGRYTVIELQTEDTYWNFELGFHDVTVKVGETVVDEWLNREQGLGWFYKSTNTGESVEGWHITIYADEACTQEIRTMITNEDGRVGYYMDPGIYWAKETGDEYGRFEDEYWMVDETVQKFEIKPHEDTSVYFTNVQYGKVKIIKTVEGDGSVAGWQFKITDADGEEIEGSPFTSAENGEILTKLLPGQYTIEELIPADSLYICTSENPQTVTIAQGQTAEVTFTNALHPGKITLDKVDIKGNSLAGATFLLEWSEDGSLWWPIEYSETFKEGGCSNPNVVDGLLTTGADGKLEWDNLHPGLQYRLTETQAPRGYTKLRKPAFEGELPEEDFSLEVKVINSRTFSLPETGSKSLLLSSISLSVCLFGLIASMLYLRKKEQ
ncbi:MAG: hypothetical protein IJN67_14980 [Oscillospiraceae bacterium]|nr:hypothetical protein [Oscillospiraceae bacterium]MBQ7002316.1 hypothetical protein [Oscillospiraceae bacterium]